MPLESVNVEDPPKVGWAGCWSIHAISWLLMPHLKEDYSHLTKVAGKISSSGSGEGAWSSQTHLKPNNLHIFQPIRLQKSFWVRLVPIFRNCCRRTLYRSDAFPVIQTTLFQNWHICSVRPKCTTDFETPDDPIYLIINKFFLFMT